MKILLFILIAAFSLFSCRSPQRLIEKAVKKDPKVLNQYADTLYIYTDSIDTVRQEVIRYIESEPRIIERIIDNRKEIKKERIEARNERQKTRQTERTERKRSTQDNRTNRTSLREFGRSTRVGERQGARTERQHKRQEERTNRSTGWWLFAILLAFILGMLTPKLVKSK